MIKYIRKNQKKVLAIFSVGLMIAFALPTATSQLVGNREINAGTMNHGKVKLTQRDLNRYQAEWRQLKEVRLGDMGMPVNLGAALLGQQAAQSIDQHEELFMLLVKEAQDQNVIASDDLVKGFMTNQLGLRENSGAEVLYPAVKDLMSVLALAGRAANVYKISQPELDRLRAALEQRMSLNLIEYRAGDFLKDVAEPTEQQVKEQFEKYRSVDKDLSPSGFGYHFPNRIKFDAITLREENIRQAIDPIDLDTQTEYFQRHRGEFVTQAAANSPEAFKIDNSPATRPMEFKEAQDKIVKKLTEERVSELTEKVREAIRNTMKADFEAWRAAVDAKKQPLPNSSLGVPYNSYQYLQAIRQKIQKDFKRTITTDKGQKEVTIDPVIEDNSWTTPTLLAESEIGKYTVPGTQATMAQVLTQLADPFLTPEEKSKVRPDLKVGLWEPSPAFTGTETSLRKLKAAAEPIGEQVLQIALRLPPATVTTPLKLGAVSSIELPFPDTDKQRWVIARIAEADPAHDPASLDVVRTQVVNDVKTTMAYEKAKQAANQALDQARSGKWLQTVAADQKRPLLTTGLIGFGSDLAIKGLELKDRAKRLFSQRAFGLLAQTEPRSGSAPRPAKDPTTKPSTQPVALQDHPVGLIELPAQGIVLAAEVDVLLPMWTKDSQAYTDLSTASSMRGMIASRLRQVWFNPDNIRARTGYQPERGSKEQPPAPKPQENPFANLDLP